MMPVFEILNPVSGIEGQGMHSKNAYGIICVRNSGTVRGVLALTF